MKTIKRIFLLAFAALIFGNVHTLNAQVTIGSELEPASGALLDLKENADGSATKGLNLPKVALSDLKKLSPCVSDNDVNATPSLKAKHKGLLVYNTTVDTNVGLEEGMYSWDGVKWVKYMSLFKPQTKVFTLPAGEEYLKDVETVMWQFEIEEAGFYGINLNYEANNTDVSKEYYYFNRLRKKSGELIMSNLGIAYNASSIWLSTFYNSYNVIYLQPGEYNLTIVSRYVDVKLADTAYFVLQPIN